ncbi:MAG: hypothetical protein SWH78_16520 [Thermodesulfobacteriota bacterium]|nr:hypothetical protein [Thermodesulfobacteriota bacterium]
MVCRQITPARNRMCSFWVVASLAICGYLFNCGRPEDVVPATNAIKEIVAVRCPHNPLVTFSSSKSLGKNINGPSVIRVPPWISNPLGKYYMYFAHHHGKLIRLAYADFLAGPWKIYEPGTLKLEQARAFKGHIASPDVYIDNERKELRMYFHGKARFRKGQWTGVATSKNGLDFEASGTILGTYYFRVFRWNGFYYALSKRGDTGWGELSRSEYGMTPFKSRGRFVAMMRHPAVMLRRNHLIMFYSRKGDAPERILASTVALGKDWLKWVESEPMDVIRPEKDYEGTRYPNKPSSYGSAIEVQQLRDPCIFEEDGKTYLFYSISGEMGIAMAELKITMNNDT